MTHSTSSAHSASQTRVICAQDLHLHIHSGWTSTLKLEPATERIQTMGRGTPGYSTAHLLPLGQKPTSAGPASSCAATHAHTTTQASSIDQHSAVQEPQPQQCLQHLEKNHLEKNQWRRTKMADIKMPTTSTKTNGWSTSTTSGAALPPAAPAPDAANPPGPSRATNSPGTSPTERENNQLINTSRRTQPSPSFTPQSPTENRRHDQVTATTTSC